MTELSERPGNVGGDGAALFLLVPAVLFACADYRFSVGGKGFFTLSPFELLTYMLLLPVVWAGVMASPKPPEPARQPGTVSVLLYTAWVLIAALSYRIASIEVGDGAQTISSAYPYQMDLKALVPAVVTYLAISSFVQSKWDLRLLVGVWFVGATANAILAIVQYFTGGPHPVPLADIALEKLNWSGEVTEVVVSGFYGHPNTFAQVMIPWFVVAGVRSLSGRIHLSRIGWLVMAALLGAALFGTASKGALAWSLCGIALALVLAKRPRFRRMWLLVGAWFSIIVLLYGGGLLIALHEGVTALATLGSRVELSVAAYHLFVEHPVQAIVGGGLVHWPDYVAQWSIWQFYDAHNVYLNQMLRYGLIGLSLYAAFLFSMLNRCLRVRGGDTLARYSYVGALFAMMGSYVFEPSFATITQKFQLLFVAAVLTAINRITDDAKESPRESPIRLPIASTAAGERSSRAKCDSRP